MPNSLQEAAAEVLDAVQSVLEAAYHNCHAECCGRAGLNGCCGGVVQVWSAEDQRIMDVLGPIERKLREALRTALAAEADRVSGWRPIETAPKDGTEILLSSPKGAAMANGAWIGLGWSWPYLRREPTHWQPLPARPEVNNG